MKILIIGGSGFIGVYLANLLISKKHDVTVLDIRISKNLDKKIKFIKGDITKKNLLEKVTKRFDYVYHFAGVSDIEYSLKNPIKTININILGTYNVLQACLQNKIKRIIFGSTIYVHSSQGSFYKISKQTSELMIREYKKRYNLSYTILRFGSVYGIGADKNNGITKIINNYLKNPTVLQYDGSKLAQRKFIHVNDVALTCNKILHKNYKNKTILVTGGKNIKIVDLMIILKNLLKTKAKIKFKNHQQIGHYILHPNKEKKIKIYQLKFDQSKKLKKNLVELIESIKKNN